MEKASQPRRPKAGGVTSTQENILRAVGQLGVATASDISRKLYQKGSTSYVRALMKGLAEGPPRYLFRCSMAHAPGNFTRLYMLTRRGRDFLRTLGVEVHVWYRAQQASTYGFSLLQHHHAVAQFIVATELFVRRYPEYHLREMRPGFSLAARSPSFTLDAPGQSHTTVVLPDVWMHLERNADEDPTLQNTYLWVEIDHGTEAQAKFHQMLRNRINFVRLKGYEAFFGTPSVLFAYLVIGTTMDARLSRLHTLRDWTLDVLVSLHLADWASGFRFSTIDDYLYDTLMLFTDPVWYMPDADTLVPLFPNLL